MAEKYTPTTEQVRETYVRAMRNAFVASAGEHRAEFDRWLADRDARVLESAADTVGPRLAGAGWLRELATGIRKGEAS